MAITGCKKEEIPVKPTSRSSVQSAERMDFASVGTCYSRILAKLFNDPQFRNVVENYFLEQQHSDSHFTYVVKLSELRHYYDSQKGEGSFDAYLAGVLDPKDHAFVLETIEGISGVYPVLFIPYYHDSIGGISWNLSEAGEVLLDYYTGSELIRGYSFRGDSVQYEVSRSELLRRGRVIFAFSDGEGNNVGGFTLGERKFWGWDCEYIGDCNPDNGCVEICQNCDYYAFGIKIKSKLKINIVGCLE